jgi:hypothetical protein
MRTREDDIQELCKYILDSNVQDSGDYGSGWCCPYCQADYNHKQQNEALKDLPHEKGCIVLIAKDLSAGVTNAQNKG